MQSRPEIIFTDTFLNRHLTTSSLMCSAEGSPPLPFANGSMRARSYFLHYYFHLSLLVLLVMVIPELNALVIFNLPFSKEQAF